MGNIKLSIAFLFFIVCFFASPTSLFASVLINEVHSFGTNDDWIELYATETTDISGWKLHDSAEGSPIIATIPSGITILQFGFYVVEVNDRLNRDGDVVTLYKSDGSTVANTFIYGKQNSVCAPESGQSVGRYPGDAASSIDRFASPTKGATNQGGVLSPCPTPTPTSTSTPTHSPTLTSTLTPSPTKTPTKTPSPTSTEVEEEEVLSEEDEITPTHDRTPTPLPSLGESHDSNKDDSKFSPSVPIPVILLGLAGIVFIGVGVVLFLKKRETV